MTTQTQAMSGESARRAVRNAGAIAIARVLSSAILFGWQAVLGNWLGVSQFGLYNTVTGLMAIAIPITSGIGVIVIRDVAREPDKAGRYLSSALFLQTLLSLLSYVGINLAALALGYPDEIRAFVAIAGISLFIDTLGTACYEQLLAHERMVITSMVDVGHVFVRIVLAGLALFGGFNLLGVYAATLAAGLVRTGILGWSLWRTGVRPQWPLDRVLARQLIINSAPLALSAFLNMAYQHADKIITTSLSGTQITGYLGGAFVIFYGVVELLNTTILVAIYPLMSRIYSSAGDLFGFMVQKLAFFTLLVSLPLSLTLTLFAADVTVPLFGEDFRPSADVLRVLIWYALVMMVTNVFAQAMMVQNQQRRLVVIRAGGLVLNIALLFVFVGQFGAPGAALASFCAEIVVFTLIVSTFRAPGMNLRVMLPRVGRLAGVGILTAGTMIALGTVHPVLGIAGGLALYTAGIFAGRVLAADEWDLLYRLLSAMPGGAVILRFWRRDVHLNW